MIIDAQLASDYPKCAHYIRTFLANPDTFKAKYGRVYDAFLRACTIDLLDQAASKKGAQLAREALTDGDGPLVKLGGDPNNPDEGGVFDPGVALFQYSK